MEIHYKIVGVLLMILALIHLSFSKRFHWKEELRGLSLINRQMMVVHTFFIALTVFLMGVICLTNTEALITTPLGKTISLGFGIFWIIRLVFQFFVYSPDLWKGKRFETIIHIIFTLLWIYISSVFLICSLPDFI
ncbi:hypothetical protein [Elizabethkingia meningoseptica]|uniref:hypothetical protein n=1 Tax=Elizabethkingia meningoseptica TaxID=238 RepID=UPI00389234CB